MESNEKYATGEQRGIDTSPRFLAVPLSICTGQKESDSKIPINSATVKQTSALAVASVYAFARPLAFGLDYAL